MRLLTRADLARVFRVLLLLSAGACTAQGCAAADGAKGLPRGPASCGNGKLDPGEDCDDHNLIDKDGCDSDCTLSCSITNSEAGCSDLDRCNGVERCTEDHVCQQGTPLRDGTPCGTDSVCTSGACQVTSAVCGDGIVVAPREECEDGNTAAGDGCFDCKWECLGSDPSRQCASSSPCRADGVCNTETHVCAPGPAGPDGTDCQLDLSQPSGPDNLGVCRGGSCAAATCGNATPDPGEECDDGNTTNGDGCNNDCRFSCVPTDATRNCDTGDVCKGVSTCNATTHVCSIPVPKKAGDDCGSTATTAHYCSNQNGSLVCTVARCGNAKTEPKEDCDDGNTNDLDGCRNNCTFTCKAAADCSDGKQCTKDDCNTTTHKCTFTADPAQAGQPCSESGVSAGHCSSGVCTPIQCGDGIKDAGEDCDLKDQNGKGLGCTANCKYECSSNTACQDGDPCTGDETCVDVPGGKSCTNPADLSDGTVCQASPRKICRASRCTASSCGDGYLDTAGGEQCEPPNTMTCSGNCQTQCDLSGTWALFVDTVVNWSGTLLFNRGSGHVITWGKITRTHSATEQQDNVVPCGIILPDFAGSALAPNDQYGLSIGTSWFDNPLPVSTAGFSLSSATVGGTFKSLSATTTFLGLAALSPPTQTWPSLGNLTLVDHDGDKEPAITATLKSGNGYDLLRIGLFDHADKVYLALRQVVTFDGTLDSCSAIHGGATVSAQNSHVAGCHVAGKTDCGSFDRDNFNSQWMVYQPASATFKMQKVSSGATCADVRAALPYP